MNIAFYETLQRERKHLEKSVEYATKMFDETKDPAFKRHIASAEALIKNIDVLIQMDKGL
jgi:hypothetical protein